MAAKPKVISAAPWGIKSALPPTPKASKVEPEPSSGLSEWRSRPTAPNFLGETEPPFLGTEREVRARADADEVGGMAPVVEERVPGAGWMPRRKIVTVEQLSHEGLARERIIMVPRADGSMREDKRWEISPEGQRRINESMGP